MSLIKKQMVEIEPSFSLHRVTSGPKYHFKPYYDMQPWDITGRYLLCMESDFQDRPPTAGGRFSPGYSGFKNGEFKPLARTYAWNFQQGCLPHWLPTGSGSEVIYNDRIDGDFRAVVLNVHTGKRRILPRAIQAITPDGKKAVCLNFSRWGEWRPGYGYAGIPDPFRGQAQPAEEAVYLMDLATGKSEPLVFLPEVVRLTSDRDLRKGSPMWFCHLMFNTDGTRLAGLVRWWCENLANKAYQTKVNIDGAVPSRRHCLWIINLDKKELKIVVNDGLVSHAEWRDPDHILTWANTHNTHPQNPPAYIIFNVRNGSYQVLGRGLLTEDGHMSYSGDRKWLLTDTYPDEQHMRTLKVFNIATGKQLILGRFYAPPYLKGELRCDLHPCWSRDYKEVCIDSIHDRGQRQVYVLDVSAVGAC